MKIFGQRGIGPDTTADPALLSKNLEVLTRTPIYAVGTNGKPAQPDNTLG